MNEDGDPHSRHPNIGADRIHHYEKGTNYQ